MEPIILIAKQNALTNCYKNDELQSAREEVRDLNDKVIQFRKQLDVINEYESKLIRSEDKIIGQINMLNKNNEPTRKLSEKCRDEVTDLKSKVKEIRLSLS